MTEFKHTEVLGGHVTVDGNVDVAKMLNAFGPDVRVVRIIPPVKRAPIRKVYVTFEDGKLRFDEL